MPYDSRSIRNLVINDSNIVTSAVIHYESLKGVFDNSAGRSDNPETPAAPYETEKIVRSSISISENVINIGQRIYSDHLESAQIDIPSIIGQPISAVESAFNLSVKRSNFETFI